MKYSLPHAFVRYHRGLGKMPLRWKPWLMSLLATNMIMPLFLAADHVEAIVVFVTALISGAIFIVLTAFTGFSRLLGCAHIVWIPLVIFLITRLDQAPADTFFGLWLRAVIVLDIGSLFLDTSNVIRYLAGDRDEMVTGLSKEVTSPSDPVPRSS